MRPITDAQLEMLRAIDRLTRERGFPPTLRELGDATGIRSTNSVNDHLLALERKGAIKRTPLASRSIVITEAGRAALDPETDLLEALIAIRKKIAATGQTYDVAKLIEELDE